MEEKENVWEPVISRGSFFEAAAAAKRTWGFSLFLSLDRGLRTYSYVVASIDDKLGAIKGLKLFDEISDRRRRIKSCN